MQFIFPPDQFPGPGKWLSCPLAVHQVTCLLWRSSPPSSSSWDSRVGLPWAPTKVNMNMNISYRVQRSLDLQMFIIQILLQSIQSGLSSLVTRAELQGRRISVILSSFLTGDLDAVCHKWVISLLSRARPSGGVLSASSSSDLASLRELEKELLLTENIRNIRDNEVESENIYRVASLQGLLPHQKRQSAPYYGRRRRDAETAERPSLGWTILDPVTGREIAAWVEKTWQRKKMLYFIIRDIGTQVQLRKVRRPNPDVGAAAGQTGLSYREFQVFGLCFWSWAWQFCLFFAGSEWWRSTNPQIL